jgi:hypothetical protein
MCVLPLECDVAVLDVAVLDVDGLVVDGLDGLDL